MPQVSADRDLPVAAEVLRGDVDGLPSSVWLPRWIARGPSVRWRVDDLGDRARLVVLIRYTVTQPRLRLVLTPILQALLRRRAERLVTEAEAAVRARIPLTRSTGV